MESNSMFGFQFKGGRANPTVDSDYAEYEIPYFKNGDYFISLENYVEFVKACERLVRTSPYYSRYVSYIKNDVGLTKCQVFSNVTELEDGGDNMLEMHHGPMLSLFDYCAIILDFLINKGDRTITTFRVAKLVIDEHYKNNVQVVMLCKTAHQACHEYNGLFINANQGFGDIATFLRKYDAGVSDELRNKIRSYIETSRKYDSFDRGVLTVNSKPKEWSNERYF